MPDKTDLKGLLAAAIKGEEDARDYYAGAAKMTENELVRVRFESLSREEESHKIMLLWIYKRFTGEGKPAFVDSTAPTHEGGSGGRLPADMDGVIELAIERERAAQAFYREMAGRIEDPRARKVVEYLTEIERGHEILLKAELETFRRDEGWYSGKI